MTDLALFPILEEKRDASKRSVRAALAEQIIGMLRAYPHFVVVKGTAPLRDRETIKELMQLIANTPPVKAEKTPERDAKVTTTRIEINTNKDPIHAGKASTGYSQTNQPLGLHTDCTYMAEPYELIAMQYVRVDPEGGDSLVATVEDIVESLDGDTLQVLRQANFPFGRGPRPVLWDKNNATNIRYYRTNLDKALEKKNVLTESELAALEVLDKTLRRDDILFQFHAAAGETIFLHNTKVLHGRSGFAANSDRLMYRMRVHAACLG